MTPENHAYNIRNWLFEIQLELLYRIFENANINAKTILNCLEKDLIQIGINNKNHRKAILEKIQKEKRKIKWGNVLFVFIGLVQLATLFLHTHAGSPNIGIELIAQFVKRIAKDIEFIDTIIMVGIFQGILLIIYKARVIDIGINIESVKFNKIVSYFFIFSFLYIPVAGGIIIFNSQYDLNLGFYSVYATSVFMLAYLIKYSFIFLFRAAFKPRAISESRRNLQKEIEPELDASLVIQELETLLKNSDFHNFHKTREEYKHFFKEVDNNQFDELKLQLDYIENEYLHNRIDLSDFLLNRNKIIHAFIKTLRKYRIAD